MKRHLLKIAFPGFEQYLYEALNEYGVLRSFQKDEMIVKMGQKLIHSYLIMQGSVKVCRESENGSEFLVAFLKTGESFAMTICEDNPPETKKSLVTLYAVKTTYVLCLPLYYKDMLAKKFDSWYNYMLSTSIMYYGFYLKVIDNIAFKNLDRRIEFFLEGLSITTNSKYIHATHKEIANSLNCSREAVSRQLKAMQESGKIVLGHNRIELVNMPIL